MAEVFSNGAICRLKLVNFMVHEFFDWVPCAGVNLLTGKNGAGKSSILQAIVLGLGGKAVDTKRSTKLGKFVRNGTHKAEIRIHLWNGGPESHRKDVYGQEIVFERIIHLSGSTHQTIRTQTGSTVYTGKIASEERARILEKYMIDLTNPIVVLQQEEAKNFFQSESSAELYDYFMRDSLLKNVEEETTRAMTNIKCLQRQIDIYEKKRDEAARERDKWKKFHNDFNALHKSQLANGDNNKKIKWGFVRACEKEYEAKKAEVGKKRAAFVDARERLSAVDEAICKLSGERDKAGHELASIEDRLSAAEKRREETKAEIGRLKKANDDLAREIKGLDGRRKQLAASIRDSRENVRRKRMAKAKAGDADADAGSHEDRKAELARKLEDMDATMEAANGRMKKLGDEREALTANIKRMEEEERKLAALLRAKCKECDRMADELRKRDGSAGGGNVGRFGRQMARLVEMVDRQADRFRRKPVGPIGRHMRLVDSVGSDAELAALIETQIGSDLLLSFIVDNDADQKQLRKVMSDVGVSKEPSVFVRKFASQRYDISGKRVSPDRCDVLVDFIEFDNDVVFNLVVDRTNLEQIIVTDHETAKSLFRTKSSVPANALMAITRDFYRFYPPTLGNYASYFMSGRKKNAVSYLVAAEDHARQQRANLKAAEDERADIESKVKAARGKKAAFHRDHELNRDRSNAERADLDRKRRELSMLKAEHFRLTEETKTVEDDERLVKSCEDAMAEIKNEEAAKRTAKKANQEQSDGLEAPLKAVQAEMDRLLSSKADADERLRDCDGEISKKAKEKAFAVREMERLKRSFEEVSKEARLKKLELETGERDALQLTNGVRPRPDEQWSPTEVTAHLKEIAFKIEELTRKLGLDRAAVAEKFKSAEVEFKRIDGKLATMAKHSAELRRLSVKRSSTLVSMKARIIREIRRSFIVTMGEHGLIGKLEFDKRQRTLDVMVDPAGGVKAGDSYVTLDSLSGGERSKTLVCLIHTLWQHQSPPFRCLDEWDVFLDDRSRRDVELMLVNSTKNLPYQFFFISPQNMSFTNDDVVGESDRVKVTVISQHPGA